MSSDYYMTRADLARVSDITSTYLEQVQHGASGQFPQALTRELASMEADGRSVTVTLAILKLLDDMLAGHLHSDVFVEAARFNSIYFHEADELTDYRPGVPSL